jgi:hypothetical protein
MTALAGAAGCGGGAEADASETPNDSVDALVAQNRPAPGLDRDAVNGNHLVLLADGRASTVLPEWGLLGETPGVCTRHPLNCGRYTVDDREVHIESTAAGSHPWVFRFDGDGYVRGQGEWRLKRVAPVDGLVLNGTYVSPPVNERYPESNARIRFTPGGRFAEQHLYTGSAWSYGLYADPQKLGYAHKEDAYPYRSVPGPSGGEGTYAIRRHTLELRDTDGPVARIAFYVTDTNRRPAGPKAIHLNGREMPLIR